MTRLALLLAIGLSILPQGCTTTDPAGSSTTRVVGYLNVGARHRF